MQAAHLGPVGWVHACLFLQLKKRQTSHELMLDIDISIAASTDML
jgi:hypothetical protein